MNKSKVLLTIRLVVSHVRIPCNFTYKSSLQALCGHERQINQMNAKMYSLADIQQARAQGFNLGKRAGVENVLNKLGGAVFIGMLCASFFIALFLK